MRLFIGNLSPEANEDDLQQACQAFGEVKSLEIVTENGHSKGFAFLEMASKEAAQAALTGLNGIDIKGQALKVSEARPDRRGFAKGGRQQAGFKGGNPAFNQRGPGASKAGGSKGGFNQAKGSSSKV